MSARAVIACAIAMPLALGTAEAAGADAGQCSDAIRTLEQQLEQKPKAPSPAEQWNPGAGSSGSSVDRRGNSKGENWAGASQDKHRARELLANARRMIDEQKPDGCLQLVREARRAVGLE